MDAGPIELTVLFDPREEDWRSMDLVGDMLVERWRREADECASSRCIPRCREW